MERRRRREVVHNDDSEAVLLVTRQGEGRVGDCPFALYSLSIMLIHCIPTLTNSYCSKHCSVSVGRSDTSSWAGRGVPHSARYVLTVFPVLDIFIWAWVSFSGEVVTPSVSLLCSDHPPQTWPERGQWFLVGSYSTSRAYCAGEYYNIYIIWVTFEDFPLAKKTKKCLPRLG